MVDEYHAKLVRIVNDSKNMAQELYANLHNMDENDPNLTEVTDLAKSIGKL